MLCYQNVYVENRNFYCFSNNLKNKKILFAAIVIKIMFGPRGGCAYCGCRKYKKQKGFTCSCGHNLQNHAEAQPTADQIIAWQQYLHGVRSFLLIFATNFYVFFD